VVESLGKTYADGTEAVRGVTIRVAASECYGLLGPIGADKSTMVGMLGTRVRPTSGRASVAGFDVVAQPQEVRRRVGFAMQEVDVDAFATAHELLVLQGRLHGLQRAGSSRRAELLLAMVDLAETADKRLSELSGGMQRRVDLAASLTHLPRSWPWTSRSKAPTRVLARRSGKRSTGSDRSLASPSSSPPTSGARASALQRPTRMEGDTHEYDGLDHATRAEIGNA
jgi:predicted ABC-type transport system involved in lysophospholipase L1 biosynthesis ATPase subunit